MRFVGHAPDARLSSPWPLLEGSRFTAVPRQVHSASVRRIRPRRSAVPADALVTQEAGIALLVVTADCVPLLAFDGRSVVAVHAGWRGIASEIVPRALACLDRDRPWRAWLGPHIGPCCYEVSAEVVEEVASASTDRAAVPDSGTRPHLDLATAVLAQADLGDDDRLTVVAGCTKCEAEALHSYRREGIGGGRNLAAIAVVDGR